MSICNENIDVNCDECYEVSRSDSSLNFIYGLTPSTQYYLWVIDKFRNVYKNLFTSGVDGSFDIDLTDYPDGMFNPYAGDFEVFISSDVAGDTVIPLTVYATPYNCLILTISSATEISCSPNPRSSCDPAYVTDSDGSTIVEVPSGDAFTCTPVTPCDNATVENSNASYSESVASGGNLALPNIDFTDSDGTTASVPSMENIVATLCNPTTFNMVVNQNGVEIYNEVWDAADTNIININ